MSRDGRLYIDEAELAPGELAAQLAALPRDAAGKPPLVTLRADKSLDYGAVMAVMAAHNRAGFTSISLVTVTAGAPVPVTGSSAEAP